MCVLKKTNKLLLIVPLLVEVLTLEVVPIEKNVILNTEYIIRNVTNDIFVELKLKGVKNNTRLQNHNIVHNFFTKLGAADQHTLAAVNTVSRFDKTNINNITHDFMDILKELLQEDWINDEDKSLTTNINVLKFISNYLSGGGHEKKQEDFNEVIQNLENEVAEESMVDHSNEESIYGMINETGENEFWNPGFSGRRIYQGKKTKIKIFPFMASIQIFQSFQCGGSIIKSDLILTAASCLQLAYNNRFFRENPAFLSVRVGSDFYQGGGENIEALEVYFEPSYDPKTLKHNLAIIRLSRRIKFRRTKKVRRIEIDRKAHNVPINAGPVMIIGWGARTSTNILDNPWSNPLSYAEQGIYHYHDCEDIYTKEYVTRTNFCAGSIAKGSGACNKDAGDPGVIAGILVGVASFGSPVCGTPDVPTVFTKVGYYAEWIDDIMEQRVPTRKKSTTTMRPYRPPTRSVIKEVTSFSLAPIVRIVSNDLYHKVPNELPEHLLRNKNKDQDEELKNILYKIIDDTKDPSNLRDRIEEILPQIKKYATTPKPSTTEEFLTTDISNQKHTIIDRVINEDVDLNIAQIIDNLDGGDDSAQEQLTFEEPTTKEINVKKSKVLELTDISDQHEDMVYSESVWQEDKKTGVSKAEAFNLEPVDDDIKELEPLKQHTPKTAKNRTNKGKLEPIKQDLKKGKPRDSKPVKLPPIHGKPLKLPERSVKKLKLPENPVKKHKLAERPVKKLKLPESPVLVQPVTKKEKWDIEKEIIAEDDGDLDNKNKERQAKLLKSKLKQPASNFNNKPIEDGVVNDVLGTRLEENLGGSQGEHLGEIDEDGLAALDDTSIADSLRGVTDRTSRGGVNDILNINDGLDGVDEGLNTGDGVGAKVYELAAEIDDTLKEGSPKNNGKVKKSQKTVKGVKGAIKSKDEIFQYDEYDYNPAVKYDQKDKKEDVLTLSYLSSEEANKVKKKNELINIKRQYVHHRQIFCF